MVVGGDGMGRLPDGRVVFVQEALPGELVEVRLIQNKKDFARGLIHQIIEPSPFRQIPPCRYHGICGGCGLQQTVDQNQRDLKQALIRDELKRALPQEAPAILPMLFSDETFGYRHRVQLHQHEGKLGYHMRSSNHICEIDECLVASSAINQKIKQLGKDPNGRPASTRFEILDSGKNKSIMRDSEEVEDFVFSQVNPFANELLRSTLVRWTRENPSDHYIELFAGNGNLSFPLLKTHSSASLWAAEMNEISCRSAQDQIAALGLIGRAYFFQMPVERFLENRILPSSSHLVLDPPRAGLTTFARARIAESELERIFYVSCALPTFLRDAQLFCRGMRLKRVQPFDFFPQTPHVELLAEFERN